MPQSISDAYIMGISEGRELLNSIKARGEIVTRADMRVFADNCRDNLKRGFGREMADTFRGERDFWANQIKKAGI